MDEPREHHAKQNKSVPKRQMMHDSTCVRYLKPSISEKLMVVARGKIRGKGEVLSLIMGTELQFCEIKF